MDPVIEALRDQLGDLHAIVEPLDESGWARASACPGWSVADVLLHLAQTNEMAAASARGSLLDTADGAVWGQAGSAVDDAAAAAVASQRGVSGAEIRDRWRRSTDAMVAALDAADPNGRVQWVVGDMSPRTLATTRIAETWIHTGDIAHGLGVDVPPTDRLRHIAFLVHRTIPYAFTREGLDEPDPVAFVLTPPAGGNPWVFGDPEAAATVVRGPAHDLCLVAGQRADATATTLEASGRDGEAVLTLMRTFA